MRALRAGHEDENRLAAAAPMGLWKTWHKPPLPSHCWPAQLERLDPPSFAAPRSAEVATTSVEG